MKNKYVTGASTSDQMSELEKKNRRIAYKAASEGIVLLQNKNNTLPIEPGKIALFGAGASETVKGGSGSGEVNERYNVTIMEGLLSAGFEITTKKWIEDFNEEYQRDKDRYTELMKKTSILKLADVINIMNDPLMLSYGREISDDDIKNSHTDTAVYVVARQAGEGSDKKMEKGEFDLSEIEKKNIKKIAANYKKTVLVINSGSQMDLSILDETEIGAVLFFCQQGEEGGTAFADILTGKVNPSGKLTDSWVKKYSDFPFADKFSYLSGDTTKSYYREGIYVGYRYFDEYDIKLRWPFGYGLSYTGFSYRYLEGKVDKQKLNLRVEVTNIGDRAGKEVIQVYETPPQGKLPKECKRLVAFEKTTLLAPRESEELNICVDLRDCTSYDEQISSYILEKGDYIFQIGTVSTELEQVCILRLNDTVVVRKVQNICPVEERIQELSPVDHKTLADPKVEIIEISSDYFATETIDYSEPDVPNDTKINTILNKLSIKEMAILCNGQGYGGMMRAEQIAVPGAIGKTTDKLIKKGIWGVNLSDGPAGIRILKTSAIRDNGKLKMGEFFMSFMEFFPEFVKKGISLDSKKDTVLYQFCTAFPVGTSLAQSWNKKMLEEVGACVGEEMDKYLISYWLAPAMNIHRNPLCGRNFEYYSEDPYLSGIMGAAIVKGVQSKPGRYATIKHFAANNQEDNRNRSDSIMDERVLREIYLKVFEICIRESSPASVMTSYNLLNGIYTANNKDIVTKVLRNEWGFCGVVMSDWYSTGKGLASPQLAIKAGNDLIMPGGKTDEKGIIKAIKSGQLEEKELRISSARIIKQILNSNVADIGNGLI